MKEFETMSFSTTCFNCNQTSLFSSIQFSKSWWEGVQNKLPKSDMIVSKEELGFSYNISVILNQVKKLKDSIFLKLSAPIANHFATEREILYTGL